MVPATSAAVRALSWCLRSGGGRYRRAPLTGEFAAIDRIAGHLRRAGIGDAPPGERWIGDDAAVVAPPAGPLLLAADAVVEGVHFVLGDGGHDPGDVGWKALVVNLSDIAAMGGRPLHALLTVVGPPGTALDDIAAGVAEAAAAFRCPVVGGDLSTGAQLVVSVAVTGTVDGEPGPVTRGGARPGDVLYATGPLGGSAAGRRAAGRPDVRHRRPVPRIAEGAVARRCGATAMVDVSDGLAGDLHRVAVASGVGFDVDDVPLAPGATEADGLHGGEDYELLFTVPAAVDVAGAFRAAGLAPPLRLGTCGDDGGVRLRGVPVEPGGWEHPWS